jgi:hypothetical protein
MLLYAVFIGCEQGWQEVVCQSVRNIRRHFPKPNMFVIVGTTLELGGSALTLYETTYSAQLI